MPALCGPAAVDPDPSDEVVALAWTGGGALASAHANGTHRALRGGLAWAPLQLRGAENWSPRAWRGGRCWRALDSRLNAPPARRGRQGLEVGRMKQSIDLVYSLPMAPAAAARNSCKPPGAFAAPAVTTPRQARSKSERCWFDP